MSKQRIKIQNPREEEHLEEPERNESALELPEEAAELFRTLETERDEAVAARHRALADFANYQRRAAENERRAVQSGAARLAMSILPVLDHFDLALNQNPNLVSAEQIIGGVLIVRDELAKALQAHGVERVEPKPNDEFNPNKHEAMMHQQAKGIEAGKVVSVLQPGYAMGDQVLRPAKVAIASSAEETDSSGNEEREE